MLLARGMTSITGLLTRATRFNENGLDEFVVSASKNLGPFFDPGRDNDVTESDTYFDFSGVSCVDDREEIADTPDTRLT